MNTADFIKQAGDLAKALERYGITKSRYCAVTLYSGDGICVEFDRSDNSAAVLHRRFKNAFRESKLIMSYVPSNLAYGKLPMTDFDVVDDPMKLRSASERLKNSLLYTVDENPPYPIGDFRVLYTQKNVCIGACDMKELERSALLFEQYVRKITLLASIRSNTVSYGNDRVKQVKCQLEMMESGSIYFKNTNRAERKKQ